MSKEAYESYLNDRNRYTEAEQDLHRSYDRYLLTLAGGSIALSITFTKDLGALASGEILYILGASWGAMVFTIALVMIGSFLAPQSHGKFREALDQEAARGGDGFRARTRKIQSQLRVTHWIKK